MSVVIVDSNDAWRVTAGGFIINGLLVGILKVFSLIIVEYQEMLDAPMSLLLVGISLMMSLIGIVSPLSTYLAEKMTARKLGIFASCLSTIAFIILGSAYHIAVYIISTIILGLAFSLIFIPTYSISGKCHVRHQTLSQGIIQSGASFGALILPLMLAQLIDIYSIRGYVLILAAFSLNFAVGSVLMPTHIVSFANPKKPIFIMCQEQYGKSKRKIRAPENLRIYGQSSTRKPKLEWPPRSIICSLIIYSFGMGLCMNGYMLLSGLYGAFARSFNIDITVSAYIMIGHSCLDLVARLCVGPIVDLKLCERYLVYSVSGIVLSGLTIITSMVPSIILFYCYLIGYAILGSILMVLQILVLTDLVGLNHISSSFAIYTFVQGGMAILSYYAVGKICDVTGSYNYGICISGAMVFLGSFFILIERGIRKTRNNKHRCLNH